MDSSSVPPSLGRELERLLELCQPDEQSRIALLRGLFRLLDGALREMTAPADERLQLTSPSLGAQVGAICEGLTPPARELLFAVCALAETQTSDDGLLVEQALALAGGDWDPKVLDEVLRTGLVTLAQRAPLRVTMAPHVVDGIVSLRGVDATCATHRRAADLAGDQASRLHHLWLASPVREEDLAARMEQLGHERRRAGDLSGAGQLLRLASEASPREQKAEHRRAWALDCLIGDGDLRSAAALRSLVEGQRETALGEECLGYLAVVQGDRASAQIRLGRAWELVNRRSDPRLASVIAQRQVVHCLAMCRAEELLLWARRAVQLAGEADRETAVEAQAIRTLAVCVTRDAAEATREARELVAAHAVGPTGRRIRLGVGWLALSQDDLATATENLGAAAGTAEVGGSERISAWGQGWLARALLARGETERALQVALAASARARMLGLDLVVPLLDWSVVQVLALRGDWAGARDRVRLDKVGELDYPMMRVPSLLARASLADAQADSLGVVRMLEILEQPWAHGWVAHPGFWPWAHVLAEALVSTGDLDRAQSLLERQRRRAVDARHETEIARLDGAKAFMLAQQGDFAEAFTLYGNATAVLAARGLVLDAARVRLLHGRSLRRCGRRGEAREILGRARLDFEQVGAVAFLGRCDAELGASQPGRLLNTSSSTTGKIVLTSQELAVAELVAAGRTNKQVAAELFLSVKTVQYHLTRVYLKLGVSSRGELAARGLDGVQLA